ncbi:hypothetical protein RIF29_22310 [Crotalaria pallida]|uniref:Uncharacterized protein n=1 Tax=Crotalaria pallida TaxID=3830 RepID=A0AAN9F8Z7_CROPI
MYLSSKSSISPTEIENRKKFEEIKHVEEVLDLKYKYHWNFNVDMKKANRKYQSETETPLYFLTLFQKQDLLLCGLPFPAIFSWM